MIDRVGRNLSGKRILIVLCGFELGGAERQALHLARHLKSLNCEVEIWGHHHNKAGPERVLDICESVGLQVGEKRFRWPSRKLALTRDLLGLLFGLNKSNPDIVISYTPWPCVGIGLVWRFSRAKCFVWSQRDSDDLQKDRMTRLAYRSATGIICNASHEVGYLKRTLGESRCPTVVINNGVELSEAEKNRDQWRADLGVTNETVIFTKLANFRPQKDHYSLLLAWRHLLDSNLSGSAHLVLAGAPQESYDTVKEQCETLGLSSSVSFAGQVRDVSGLLGATDVGVLSTFHEGMPNAVMEYMAAGIPVLATDIPGARELLGPISELQLFPRGDVTSLSKQLRLMFNDVGLRHELGNQNRELADREYSVRAMCTKTTEFLIDLASSTC